MIKSGQFMVAEAGWYLTSVVGHQRYRDLEAVVVDGGTHQRSDLCGIGLRTGSWPPIVLSNGRASTRWTAVLGCLCLPSDILVDRVLLPPLAVGDLLAFPNAGAYGASASPLDFLCHSHPAEAVFDGDRIVLLRARGPRRISPSRGLNDINKRLANFGQRQRTACRDRARAPRVTCASPRCRRSRWRRSIPG